MGEDEVHNVVLFDMQNIENWESLQQGIHGVINSASWYGDYIYVVGNIEYCYGNPRYQNFQIYYFAFFSILQNNLDNLNFLSYKLIIKPKRIYVDDIAQFNVKTKTWASVGSGIKYSGTTNLQNLVVSDTGTFDFKH